ncbi:MAG TPA: hypothetical protein PLF01_05450 [Alphaproteobacteria bacterium]|nr:hypothetical protein [Alphaproteobacteria bacterium]
MAQKGYWVICEDLYAGNKKTREPSVCIGHVDGFDYAEAMGGTRMEVLSVIRCKLKDNIRFLLDCYSDLPPLSSSDNPPKGLNKANTAYLFICLSDVGTGLEQLISCAV